MCSRASVCTDVSMYVCIVFYVCVCVYVSMHVCILTYVLAMYACIGNAGETYDNTNKSVLRKTMECFGIYSAMFNPKISDIELAINITLMLNHFEQTSSMHKSLNQVIIEYHKLPW